MKLGSLKTLQEYLKGIGPSTIPPLCIIHSKEQFFLHDALSLCTETFERLGFSVETLSEEKYTYEALNDALFSHSLFFQGKKAVILDRLDKLKGKLLDVIAMQAEQKSTSVCVIVAESLPSSSKIYKLAEDCGCVIDLTDIKPWDKAQIISDWITQHLHKNSKTITQDASQSLVKEFASDRDLLIQELTKLSLYVGARKQITSADISAVTIHLAQSTVWQALDHIMNARTKEALYIVRELIDNDIHPLVIVRAFRSQLHSALAMASLTSAGVSEQDIRNQFPQMKGKIFDKNFGAAVSRGAKRLSKNLLLIDEAEAHLKSSQASGDLILEVLTIRLSEPIRNR